MKTQEDMKTQEERKRIILMAQILLRTREQITIQSVKKMVDDLARLQGYTGNQDSITDEVFETVQYQRKNSNISL